MPGMTALATIQYMAKTGDGSVNVQGRLTLEEVAELDREAADQPIPVRRAALVSHILREWLRQRRDAKGKQKGGGR